MIAAIALVVAAIAALLALYLWTIVEVLRRDITELDQLNSYLHKRVTALEEVKR